VTEEINDEIIKLFNPCTQMYLNYVAGQNDTSAIDALKDLIHQRLLPHYGYQLHDRIQNAIAYALQGPHFNPSLPAGHKVSTSNDMYAPYDIEIEGSLYIEVKTSIQTPYCTSTFTNNIRKQIAKYFELKMDGPTLLIQYQRLIDYDMKEYKTEMFYALSTYNEDEFQREVIQNNEDSFWSAAYINCEFGKIEVFTPPDIKEDQESSGLNDIISLLKNEGPDAFKRDVYRRWQGGGLVDIQIGRHKTSVFNKMLERITGAHESLKRKKTKKSKIKCCIECEMGYAARVDDFLEWYCPVKNEVIFRYGAVSS
tara:strand:+ start:766 stop:1698 length:933 start_codon:yes stop_codon:yes gene_type:complete